MAAVPGGAAGPPAAAVRPRPSAVERLVACYGPGAVSAAAPEARQESCPSRPSSQSVQSHSQGAVRRGAQHCGSSGAAAHGEGPRPRPHPAAATTAAGMVDPAGRVIGRGLSLNELRAIVQGRPAENQPSDASMAAVYPDASNALQPRLQEPDSVCGGAERSKSTPLVQPRARSAFPTWGGQRRTASGPTSKAASRARRNPFIEWDSREMVLMQERTRLQEDEAYMLKRKEDLRRGAMQKALAQRCSSQMDLFEKRAFYGNYSVKLRAAQVARGGKDGRRWAAAVPENRTAAWVMKKLQQDLEISQRGLSEVQNYSVPAPRT
mmetsp:Transcript_84252/g.272681  ORF Transcript_84252/g.272681 Transcript_84252/m.272681 type:complete len:322 (-) Transcript_84252:52-1017(-)